MVYSLLMVTTLRGSVLTSLEPVPKYVLSKCVSSKGDNITFNGCLGMAFVCKLQKLAIGKMSLVYSEKESCDKAGISVSSSIDGPDVEEQRLQ